MQRIQVQFLGSGDAFGSGGRLQTCILVKATTSAFLVDCGATVLIGMRRFGVHPNDIDLILLTHLHGDHFGGTPFLVLDAQLISKRIRPLVIAGPSGTRKRIAAAMEMFFPGSSLMQQRFPLEICELTPEHTSTLGDVAVTPFAVRHPSGDPALALRIACAGKVLACTGGTQWTETLLEACRGADLLIAEAYFYEKHIPFHLDLQTVLAYLDEMRPKRLMVTHMSADMLSRLAQVPCDCADDGTCLEV